MSQNTYGLRIICSGENKLKALIFLINLITVFSFADAPQPLIHVVDIDNQIGHIGVLVSGKHVDQLNDFEKDVRLKVSFHYRRNATSDWKELIQIPAIWNEVNYGTINEVSLPNVTTAAYFSDGKEVILITQEGELITFEKSQTPTFLKGNIASVQSKVFQLSNGHKYFYLGSPGESPESPRTIFYSYQSREVLSLDYFVPAEAIFSTANFLKARFATSSGVSEFSLALREFDKISEENPNPQKIVSLGAPEKGPHGGELQYFSNGHKLETTKDAVYLIEGREIVPVATGRTQIRVSSQQYQSDLISSSASILSNIQNKAFLVAADQDLFLVLENGRYLRLPYTAVNTQESTISHAYIEQLTRGGRSYVLASYGVQGNSPLPNDGLPQTRRNSGQSFLVDAETGLWIIVKDEFLPDLGHRQKWGSSNTADLENAFPKMEELLKTQTAKGPSVTNNPGVIETADLLPEVLFWLHILRFKEESTMLSEFVEKHRGDPDFLEIILRQAISIRDRIGKTNEEKRFALRTILLKDFGPDPKTPYRALCSWVFGDGGK